MARTSKLSRAQDTEVIVICQVRSWCRRIIEDYIKGRIDRGVAWKRLMAISESAYAVAVSAEPDGDITYAVASAWEKIQALEPGQWIGLQG